MKNWIVTIKADGLDDAGKVLLVELTVQVDNCPDEKTAAAIAGSHVRRYMGQRKVGIVATTVEEND